MINVGDKVRITNPGHSYSGYKNWKGLKGFEHRFVYDAVPYEGMLGIVMRKQKHNSGKPSPCLYLVQQGKVSGSRQVYIMGEGGIEKVEDFPVNPKQKLDLTKPVQTSDGRKARIIATDKKGIYPLVVIVSAHDGLSENVVSMSLSGESGSYSWHLENVPEVVTKTIYLRKLLSGETVTSEWKPASAVASTKVTFEIGKFVDESKEPSSSC